MGVDQTWQDCNIAKVDRFTVRWSATNFKNGCTLPSNPTAMNGLA
jgi:hypothetical protein